jgi:TPR repeat protein
MKKGHSNGTQNQYASGQYNLRNCYLKGIGTDKDEEKAFK